MATAKKKKMQSLQDNIDAAVELLPPPGEGVVFDDYKAKLYAQNPDGGKEAFTYMLKNNLVKTRMERDADKNLIVMLYRPA